MRRLTFGDFQVKVVGVVVGVVMVVVVLSLCVDGRRVTPRRPRRPSSKTANPTRRHNAYNSYQSQQQREQQHEHHQHHQAKHSVDNSVNSVDDSARGEEDTVSASFFFKVSTQTMWGSSDGEVVDEVVYWIKVCLGCVVGMGVWWVWVVIAAFAVSPMWGFTLVFPPTAPLALIAFVMLFGVWRRGYPNVSYSLVVLVACCAGVGWSVYSVYRVVVENPGVIV